MGSVEWHIATAPKDGEHCTVCGGPITDFIHDHRADLSGLDDGPYLPGRAPRKRPAPKPADEAADIRARAWATRRARYGRSGHR